MSTGILGMGSYCGRVALWVFVAPAVLAKVAQAADQSETLNWTAYEHCSTAIR